MSFYNDYLKIKKEHEEAILFYRVGDFYEMYGADAIVASKVLDLVLTTRDFGADGKISMCGIPHHSLDAYIDKLIQNDCKIAVHEPTMDIPKPESKDIQTQGRLNLTANGTEQTILLEYLEANASDVLVDKINNGVKLEKDGKTLISKKTLTTFMDYAYKEAQKKAEKGARFACVKSDTVFNWLIHYFEEDSIEGTLYNEDGSEYTPPKPEYKPPSKPIVTAKPKQEPQMSIFDLIQPQKTESKDEAPLKEPKKQASEPETTANIEAKEQSDLIRINDRISMDSDGVVHEVGIKESITTDYTPLTKLLGDIFIVR